MATAMLADPATPVQAVCDALRVSKATLYRHGPTRRRADGVTSSAPGHRPVQAPAP